MRLRCKSHFIFLRCCNLYIVYCIKFVYIPYFLFVEFYYEFVHHGTNVLVRCITSIIVDRDQSLVFCCIVWLCVLTPNCTPPGYSVSLPSSTLNWLLLCTALPVLFNLYFLFTHYRAKRHHFPRLVFPVTGALRCVIRKCSRLVNWLCIVCGILATICKHCSKPIIL